MLGRAILLVFALLSALASLAVSNPIPIPGPWWMVTPPLALPGQPVALTFFNSNTEPVVPNTAPWWITDAGGSIVYTPPADTIPTTIEIPTGGSLSWGWHQRDNNHNPVPSGTYTAHFMWKPYWEEEWTTSETRFEVLSGMRWVVEPDPVVVGSPASLVLTNSSDADLVIKKAGPWWITDLSDGLEYDPGGAAQLDTVVVGDSRSWSWTPSREDHFLAKLNYYDLTGTMRVRVEDPFTVVPGPPGDVAWVVTPSVNPTRGAVGLTFTNATPDTVFLPDYAPWWIEDSDETTVYSPVKPLAIKPVAPGETVPWGWNERERDGSFDAVSAPAGDYVAKIQYSERMNPWVLIEKRFDFTLIDPPSPCGFVQSDKDRYDAGETAHFTFTNCAPDTVGMLGRYTWWISNHWGFPVYYEPVDWSLVAFAGNEGFTFDWDQTDLAGEEVFVGRYDAHVMFTDRAYVTHYIASCRIFAGRWPSAIGPMGSIARLDQNFPNPFNPSTAIHYSIVARDRVSLRIYNVAGQVVRTLVDEIQDPLDGGYIISWDGTGDLGDRVSSGVYFYALTVGPFNETKKLVLIK